MKQSDLKKKIESLSALPKKKYSDTSLIDDFSDEKIHDICEACYNVVAKKLPVQKKTENQLKRKLLPIHNEVRQLANPKLKVKTKRRILKNKQVGKGIFTTISSIVVSALLSYSIYLIHNLIISPKIHEQNLINILM